MLKTIPFIERRKHRRFIVSGKVQMVTRFDFAPATLVNLGEGGILIRSRDPFPEGTRGTFHISPVACPFEIEIQGQVVGVKDDLMAVQFLERQTEVSDCVQWLANENCPWAGTVSTGTLGNTRQEGANLPDAPLPTGVPELETARDLVYQRA